MAPEALFIRTVTGPLLAGDVRGLVGALAAEWPAARIAGLLLSADVGVVEAACRCLGYVGGPRHVPQLAAQLASPHASVVAAAEDGLWAIWMRNGSERGNEQLASAVRHFRNDEYEPALRILWTLSSTEPDFAEAHHQRGMVLHTLDQLEAAEAAYKEALRLNPYHFAAASALGHIAIQREALPAAAQYYRRALAIHPGLADIGAVLPPLEEAIRRRVVA